MTLLDSNVLVEILEKKSKKGEPLYSEIIESGEGICTTLILHEIMYGLRKYGKPTKELLQLPVVDYSKEDALLSAKIEYEMEKDGTPIRRTDSIIAAVAVRQPLKLLTLDKRRFLPITKRSALKFFESPDLKAKE